MRPMIEARHLSFTYPHGSGAVLNDIDLRVGSDQLFGLLGPNGAGKTTLLSILSGLLPAPPGAVLIDGIDINREPSTARRLLSLVPQEYAFYPTLTVAENLKTFAGIQGIKGEQRRRRIGEVSELTGLGERLGQRALQLSGGLKRRLNIAIGLLNRPRLLFLDEPTVGIDPQSRRFILDAIKGIHEAGTTVVYTSHYMEEVEFLCDHIAVIDQGKLLLEGSLQQLLQQHGNTLVVQLAALPTADQVEYFTSRGFQGEGCSFSLGNVEAGEIQRHLLAVVEEPFLQIVSVHYGSRNLEDLFLLLTSRSLRD